jgi:ketosteroid isomerase-like protein
MCLVDASIAVRRECLASSDRRWEAVNTMAASEFDQLIEEQHLAVDAFAKGDDEPLAALWSRADDVTLGNPFGPFVRGFERVAETMKRAAVNYRDGEATGFELVAKYVADDIAYLVEVEQLNAKMGGRAEATPVSLRCTSIFRKEDGNWRLVHRHADPITTPRAAESVIQNDDSL